MARENMRGMETGLAQAMRPAQHIGAMVLENMERMADYQYEMVQSYTHMAVGQWRDALEIRDPQSFGEYLRKQNERAREFGEKVTGESRKLIELGQQTSREALRTGEQSARNITQFAERGLEQVQRSAERGLDQAQRNVERGAEQAQRNVERGTQQAQRGVERATEQARQTPERGAEPAGKPAKLAINDYDELNASDIDQRAEKLDTDQVRQLLNYERSNKNRKTLIEAFERRLQA